MMGGALMLLGPVILKTRFGVDEVVTTLLAQLHNASFYLDAVGGTTLKDPDGHGLAKIPPAGA